ncbi:transmembrane protein 214 [Dermacentor andersoni]|uniref:transmembrane protein 214 n=1 Tax=Dermacentor andersoni TaxID=34620 RepID=UPI0021557BBE|nr:transmembrane protein 214-like [Dermacentor andersoni]
MSSSAGQWQLVSGKSSKNKSAATGVGAGDGKMSKAQKKKLAENMPRIEPLAPLKESTTQYEALQEKEEQKKPAAPPPKPAKKPPKKKTKEASAQRATSLSVLLKQVSASEVSQLVLEDRLRFPTNPLLWAKDLVFYLNSQLEGAPAAESQPPFEGRPAGFPLNELAAEVRRQLEDVVAGTTDDARSLLWDHCLNGALQALAAPSGGQNTGSGSVVGFLVCLQLLASRHPHIVTNALPKLRNLRSQHQGRPMACLALLWAASQAGLSSLGAGLAVWLELLMPVVGTRAYAPYVIDILSELLSRHPASKNGDENAGRACNLGVRSLFPLLDAVYGVGGRLPLSPERERALRDQLYPRIRDLCYAAEPSRSAYFPSYLRRLGSGSAQLNAELLTSLEECLCRDPECLSVWRQLFERQAPQSMRLLQHLETKDAWRRLPRLTQRRLQATLISWRSTTPTSEPALRDALTQCQALERKMGGQGFPWVRLLLTTLALGVGGVIFWDVRLQHGGRFEGSGTHVLLKDTGLLSAWQKGSKEAAIYLHQGSVWAAEKLPVWYAEASRRLGPPLEAAWEQLAELTVTVWTASEPLRSQLLVHTHSLLLWGNDWVPVCMASVLGAAHETWRVVGSAGGWLLEHVVHGARISAMWLTDNLLTGPWSLEKVQSQAVELVSAAQNQAQVALHWLWNRLGSAQ